MNHRILLLPLFLAAAGCAASYKIVQPPSVGSLNGYKGVVVPTVETKPWIDANPSVRDKQEFDRWRSEIEIAAVQIPADAKAHLSHTFQILNAAAEATIFVRSELILFDPSGSLRQGTNRGRIGIRVTLLDAKNGKSLGCAEVYGSVTLGSFREAYGLCGRGIARFLLDHYVQTKPAAGKDEKTK